MQTMSRRVARWMTLAGLALGLSAVPLTEAPETGAPAPAFAAETVDGKKIALADYKGKSAVLLNFYANF